MIFHNFGVDVIFVEKYRMITLYSPRLSAIKAISVIAVVKVKLTLTVLHLSCEESSFRKKKILRPSRN